MRKLCSLVLSMVLTVALFTGVGAKTVNASQVQAISEYDMLKEYGGKTEGQLRQLGLDDETIEELFQLQETINNYRTYSPTALKELGFSEEQIYYLKMPSVKLSSSFGRSLSSTMSKSFDMEPFVKGLFAKVNFRIYKYPSEFGHSIEMKWEWSGRPFIQKRDGIIVNWDSPNKLDYESGYLIYAIPTLTEDFQRYVTLTDDDMITTDNKGFGFTYEIDGIEFREYGRRGAVLFRLDRIEGEEELTIICQYAHATLTKKVEIIVNSDGYVDFTDRSAVSTLQKQVFTVE